MAIFGDAAPAETGEIFGRVGRSTPVSSPPPAGRPPFHSNAAGRLRVCPAEDIAF